MDNDPYLTHQDRATRPQQAVVSRTTPVNKSDTRSYGATTDTATKEKKTGLFTQAMAMSSKTAKEKNDARKAAPKIGQVTLMVALGHILLFILNALVFGFLWASPIFPAASIVISLCIVPFCGQGLSAVPSYMAGAQSIPKICALIGVVAGGLTGTYAHEAYIGPYFAVAFGRDYDNVKASQPAAAFADAGKILFSPTSKVDTSRAIGYMDGRTFCVAPVIDSSFEQSRKVGFWAVGYDCCAAPRGDFRCGAVDKEGAHGGVRLSNDGILERTYEEFTKAIQQSAAVNDLVIDEDAILVKWVQDPAREQVHAMVQGLGTVILGAGFYVLLVFTVIAASALATLEHDLPK